MIEQSNNEEKNESCKVEQIIAERTFYANVHCEHLSNSIYRYSDYLQITYSSAYYTRTNCTIDYLIKDGWKIVSISKCMACLDTGQNTFSVRPITGVETILFERMSK